LNRRQKKQDQKWIKQRKLEQQAKLENIFPWQAKAREKTERS
jgi:hypothetical protein